MANSKNDADPDAEDLSPRQKEILRLVAQGFSSKEIAQLLGVSTGTIETHIGNARARLNAPTRRAAARWVIEADERAGKADARPPKTGTPIPNDPIRQIMGMAASSPSGSNRNQRQIDKSNSRGSVSDSSGKHGSMLPVVVRYIFDAVYVGLFFTIMSALAYGAHLLVRFFEERHVDEAVIMILRSVEILLAASDGAGVVIASVFLTGRFIIAVYRVGK